MDLTGMSRFGIALLFFLAACAAPSPPVDARLADGVFVITHPLRYQIKNTPHEIVVPAGFLTDLASIPRALWWFESPIDRSMAGAIIHDYLYWDQTCSKDEADAVLFVAMRESGVSTFKTDAVYTAVRTPIGQGAFDNNTEARKKGERRYLSRGYLETVLSQPAVPNDTLRTIQGRAQAAGGTVTGQPADPKALKAACGAALGIYRARSL